MRKENGEVLLSLGEMAKLTQLSAKTLRFYDEQGFVHPHWRDPETGYRYYSVDQLYRLGNVRISKALGLSMERYDDIVVKTSELTAGNFDPVTRRIQDAVEVKTAEIAEVTRQLRLLEYLSHDVDLLRAHEVGGESFDLACPTTHLLAYLPPCDDGPASFPVFFETQASMEWACLPRYGRLQGLGTLMSGFVDVRGFCCETREDIPATSLGHLPQDFVTFEVPAATWECWLVTRSIQIESWEAMRRDLGAFDVSGGVSAEQLEGKLILMQECGFFEDYDDTVFLVRVIDDPRITD